MDKIWDGNPSKSEIIGRCGGDEKPRMITRDRQKSNAKKIQIKLVPRFKFASAAVGLLFSK